MKLPTSDCQLPTEGLHNGSHGERLLRAVGLSIVDFRLPIEGAS